jgi:transcriptional regulator with XRE-family HTH domain
MARGPKPDLKRREQARALRAQGLTLAQIGERLGVSHQAVARRLGGPRRPAPRCPGCGATYPASGAGACGDRSAPCLACLAQRHGATTAQRLKAARLAAGLSQTEMALRAGLSATALGDCEGGRVRPHERSLVRLAQALGLSRQALFGPGPLRSRSSTRGGGGRARPRPCPPIPDRR